MGEDFEPNIASVEATWVASQSVDAVTFGRRSAFRRSSAPEGSWGRFTLETDVFFAPEKRKNPFISVL